jgi:hypothetical protein
MLSRLWLSKNILTMLALGNSSRGGAYPVLLLIIHFFISQNANSSNVIQRITGFFFQYFLFLNAIVYPS